MKRSKNNIYSKAQYMIVLFLSVIMLSACSNNDDSVYNAPDKHNYNVKTSVVTTIPELENYNPFPIDNKPVKATTTRKAVTASKATTTYNTTTEITTTSISITTKPAVTTTKTTTRVTAATTSLEDYLKQQREQERSKYMSGKCGDNITYTLDDNGVLRIEGKGEMYDYERGKSPFQFANGSKWNNIPPIRKVIISDGITKIGNNTFVNSVNIKNVEFPGSIISIGDSAFQNCWGITEITLPDSVLTIGNSCFNGCYGIKSFKMSGNIEYVDDWALGNLRELESITFPKGTRFGGFVFDNDPKLTIRCYASEETEKLKTSGCKIEIIED